MAPAGFSDLPTEALDEIARRVGPLDNVTCSAVCKPWRRALKTSRLGLLQQPIFPHWVTLRRLDNAVTVIPVRYSRGSERTVLLGNKKACLTRIIGCSYGWLVAVDEACGLSLVEPLTGRWFPLPPITSSRSCKKVIKDLEVLGQGMFHKAALAPGRRLGTYAVMLIHSGGHGLSFLAPGAKSWTTLRAPAWLPQKYMDVIFHKGAFYTVSLDSEVNAWAPDAGRTTAGVRARRVTEPRTERAWAVLAESASTRDDLMMVSSIDKGRQYEVSRYDELGGRWIPVKDLGKAAIFAGRSCSVCVATAGCDEAPPPLSNYLYFAQSCASSDYDYGNTNAYRLPTATRRCYGGISGRYNGSWYLPHVAPEFHHH